MRNGFSRILHQINQHLLDQDGVHHDLGKARCNVVRQAHVVAAQLNVGQLHRIADHGGHVGKCAVGLAAFDKRPDALNDLSGSVCLFGGFFQGQQQVLGADFVAFDARDHAVAIVVDGGQRLVQFMRHARRHFAHGDQPAGGLCTLILLCRLLFGVAARRDVGSNDHLCQAAIHPCQVARANLQPLRQVGDIKFRAFGLRGGQGVSGQASQAIDLVQRVVMGGRCRNTGLSDQIQMTQHLGTKPRAVHLVGKQQFFAAQRRDRNRSVQTFQNSGESLVGRRQFITNPARLGDVCDGRHPARLLAFGVNQG